MSSSGAMGDSGLLLLTALLLLLATGAVRWALGHRAPRGRQPKPRKPRLGRGIRAGGPRRRGGAPAARRARRPRAAPGQRPDAAASAPRVPCGCGPCVSAARELRELLLLPRAALGPWAPLYAGLWQALRARLERLEKRGHLPCCASAACSGRLRPGPRLLPPGMAVPARAARPPKVALRGTGAIRRGTSGRQRDTIEPGASAASDGIQPMKTPSACDRLPPESLPPAENLLIPENLPIPANPNDFPTVSLPAQSPPPLKILCLKKCFVPSECLPPSQSVTPGHLSACESASEPCQPVEQEPMDTAPCALGDQQEPPEINTTGESLGTDMPRESLEEEGAQLDPGKNSQEQQLLDEEVSCSQQCPPQGSQDAVAEAAGTSPSSVEETRPRKPWRLGRLQEAAPRRAPGTRKVFQVAGDLF